MATNAGAPAANPYAIPALSWPSWAPQEVSPILSVVFYGSLITFVLFIILLIIHYTVYPVFSFLPGDPGIIPIPLPSDKQTDFMKSPAGNDISGAFTKIVPCGYTISMDLYLTNRFIDQAPVPRIIFYNSGRGPVTSTIRDISAAVTAFPQANLIVWLDPLVNNLYASVITSDTAPGSRPVIQTTPAITNVPMKSPFRVTYVYDQNFLEVYMNGYLETSMSFRYKPIGRSSSPPFYFGHISSRESCLVGKVNYWPRELASREVLANGSPQSNVAFFTS